MLKHTISFQNAFKGIWIALTTQLNLRIHFIIGAIVMLASVYLQLPISEILILVLTISIVMITEMINTSIEYLCDAITLDHNEYIKYAKDVAAGTVLISAIFASLIGFIIFIPKIMSFL